MIPTQQIYFVAATSDILLDGVQVPRTYLSLPLQGLDLQFESADGLQSRLAGVCAAAIGGGATEHVLFPRGWVHFLQY